MKPVEEYIENNLSNWHRDHIRLFDKAKGSSHNHQAWEGGYRDHLTQCLNIAEHLYLALTNAFGQFPFSFEEVVKVLYFHDIEKMWKYTEGLPNNWDKDEYLKSLADSYGIKFTHSELNAITYIHGEGNEYKKDVRIMNELAGFCHSIDVISARVLHNKKG